MIDADQPYCADVDECNDQREDFNKLDVRTLFFHLIPFAVHCTIHINGSKHYNFNILRCAGITPTASTQWVPSAVSARMDSTAGRQIADALISTSEIFIPLIVSYFLQHFMIFS